MFPFATALKPDEMLRLGLQSSVLLAEAQAVMAMRLFGMIGLWPLGPGEEARMVSEKLRALQESQAAALKAVMRGASPLGVAEAALKPVGRRTRANARRLAKPGKLPR